MSGVVEDLEKSLPFKGFIDSVNESSKDVYVAAYQSIKNVDSPEKLEAFKHLIDAFSTTEEQKFNALNILLFAAVGTATVFSAKKIYDYTTKNKKDESKVIN
ncbi:hypothetical protein [Alkalihalobacillus sp. LMS39]|uniref:hypothetical protein n=1 Tax=Alkalihalobacillus sp. LMS39 TaxID=2924032 RepID=UPI001FB26C9D|nr:hypothetical protein [Alkalihalobacillus sp. LMS39]UOE95072.1 hypothetical protein MM271_05415 [Alkalihalobacillus sp. LMS39]